MTKKTRDERDRKSLQRRLEVLQLPAVPLRRHGSVTPGNRREWWRVEPETVGIGPGGEALAVWPHHSDPTRHLITIHGGDPTPAEIAAVEIRSALESVTFVQPMPDGLLLAAGRSRPGGPPNAQVWSFDGRLLRKAPLGDAIEHLLTTPSGHIWAGYSDEALGGTGPQSHGLARFTPDLNPDWLYPLDAGLPAIFDCYALTLTGEQAILCPYSDFHLLQTTPAGTVTDLGPAPLRGAAALLSAGAHGALIGGYGPEYDLAVPFHRRADRLEAAPLLRLVQPNGNELLHLRTHARGPDLHVIARQAWYTIGLSELIQPAH